mgnify:CR=1 FL=1
MKKFLLLLLILILLFPSAVYGQEVDSENLNTGELVDEILKEVDTYDLENIIGEINNEIGDYLPKISIKELLASISKGEFKISIKGFFIGVARYLLDELINNSGLLARIILLSIMCAILQNLQNAFDSQGVGELAYNIIYFIILGIAIKSFSTAIKIGMDSIDTMVTFIHALLPTIIILLSSVGALVSAALFQPLITLTVGMLSTFVKNFIIPLIFLGSILNLVNYISEKIQISKLAGLIRQMAIVLLGFVFTVFLGVMTIQGVAASSFDGVTARTAKYAVDNLVPIIGGFLSDAVDTIIGCSLIIKNAIGAIGLIFLFIIILFPSIKILALILIYKLSGAIIEPVANGRIVDSLNGIANSLILVLAAVISVAIMFFMVITIVIGVGNVTIMMR